jgi:hypothetical protein
LRTAHNFNDAPALSQAHVGIAVGTGTNIAIESAGVTLVKGDLRGIVRDRLLSSATMRNLKQNLFSDTPFYRRFFLRRRSSSCNFFGGTRPGW